MPLKASSSVIVVSYLRSAPRAGRRAAAAPALAAEEVLEQVAEHLVDVHALPETLETGMSAAGGARVDARLAVLVVHLSLLGVGQRLVSPVDLAEL